MSLPAENGRQQPVLRDRRQPVYNGHLRGENQVVIVERYRLEEDTQGNCMCGARRG